MDVVNKMVDLNRIMVDAPVQDVERFLAILKSCKILELEFWCDQPQELFNRLPECPSVLALVIGVDCKQISDYRFLGRLKNLTSLEINCLINERAVGKICDKLPFLTERIFRGAFLENLRLRNQGA